MPDPQGCVTLQPDSPIWMGKQELYSQPGKIQKALLVKWKWYIQVHSWAG